MVWDQIMPPAPPITEIADAFADPVRPASFPKAILRYRNQRWAKPLGMDTLSDEDWADRFTRFPPLPANLPEPLAMRYHGHQFGHYNPELGDGRGFLYAQFQLQSGQPVELGTKGTGTTPWSRRGDGRLTLKGGVREVLAARYLEALGVKTSKLFSLVETGEELQRGDEPSPTRSAVMVRLSETHIRFGTFQRAMALGQTENLARLVDHCVKHYHPDAADPDMARQASALLYRIAEAVGKMIGQWMAAGFVHGVMNTDNFNITGETFDFGPYRFLPESDPNFVAAYFDEQGLYRFGRQPAQGLWALQQLAAALSPLTEVDDLTESLSAYEPAYQQAFIDQTCHQFGVQTGVFEKDIEFLSLIYAWMTERKAPWSQVFFDWHGGPESEARATSSPIANLYKEEMFAPVRAALLARRPASNINLDTEYFQSDRPESLLIDEIETIWAAIAENDDWSLFESKLSRLDDMDATLAK
jgi:uncharacterized protein YdiU (UPF0061 family)